MGFPCFDQNAGILNVEHDIVAELCNTRVCVAKNELIRQRMSRTMTIATTFTSFRFDHFYYTLNDESNFWRVSSILFT